MTTGCSQGASEHPAWHSQGGRRGEETLQREKGLGVAERTASTRPRMRTGCCQGASMSRKLIEMKAGIPFLSFPKDSPFPRTCAEVQ